MGRLRPPQRRTCVFVTTQENPRKQVKYHKAAAVAASSHVRSCWLRPLRLVQERAAWLDHRSLPAPLALSSQLRQAMYTDQACSNTAAGACEKWGGGEDNRLSRLHIAYSKYLRREVILSLEIWKTGKRLESTGRFLVSKLRLESVPMTIQW